MLKRITPILLACCALGGFSANALAMSAAEVRRPGWEVTAHTLPTYLPPGKKGAVEIRVVNVGAVSSSGTVTVTDTLPPGVTATEAGSYVTGPGTQAEPLRFVREEWDCTGNALGEAPRAVGRFQPATVVTCVNDPEHLPSILGGGGLSTRAPGGFDPELGLVVAVDQTAQEGTREGARANRVTVAGGGAVSPASTREPLTISSTSPSFGFAGADAWFSNADGTADTQAGSHPYEATFSFDINDVAEEGVHSIGGEPRNLTVNLPAGFVGNPTAVPECPMPQFVTEERCPADTQVGVAFPTILGDGFLANPTDPVYNLVPQAGQPAEFGFVINGNLTVIGTKVRSGSDYGISSVTNNITRTELTSTILALWGEPSDPSHTPWRCERGDQHFECGISIAPTGKPFLTLPTSCEGPQAYSLSMNSWEDASKVASTSFLSHDANHEAVGFTGCEDLSFGPTISVAPDTSFADTPAGLTVEVKPPVGGLSSTEGLSTSDIQNTTVTLPEGLVINPGQAAGLAACQAAQSGLTSDAEKAAGEENSAPPSCPLASKVGEDEIQTPLLPHALKGDVYIMQSNPPNLELLVAASGEGVNLKLVGKVHLDEATGRLTSTFAGTPELPFTDFRLSFSGGARAALATPVACGTYSATSDFASWASPLVADVFPTASFAVTSGPGGSACPASPPAFTPSLTAGSTTDQAGGFTDFSLLLQAPDGQQRISRLQFKVPAGLSGMISKVPLCQEPQAAQGTCPAASQIGHTVVASGPGPYPLVVPQPGQSPAAIYLTGPYEGAPFGLSIVVPVVVGPFVLQTQVVRASVQVDPQTAQITIITDPLPQIIDGIPTDLRSIDAVIDREGFMFNPTNCNPQEFSGTAWGASPPGAGGPGATAPISSHFGMGSCQSLRFKPKFSVAASGRNSKAGGASLSVTLAYPSEPQGSEANIARVKVDLPKQLPSRLTTLQKACTAAQFASNPAGCPAASVVGHAVVHTPVLPVPLEGPAYFVSNGGEAFPNLIMVLQGYGVTVDLVGDTFINKQGITSSTFKATPDVPFSTFGLTLPQGPNSALATDVPVGAQYSLCARKLSMPTELVAQNGAVINQATAISISGCAKKKALTRAQKLAAALKACHKKHNHAKRRACERTARRKYGAGRSKKK
jgi:hypothetical protein